MTAAVASSTANSATAAYGLDFKSLLQIILTQLTYQDPLKPMDNFEFVSQLGQFSQLEQAQSLNTQVSNLLTSQSTTQATGLLGRTVDFTNNTTSSGSTATQSGTVSAVVLSSSGPTVTVTMTGGQIVSDVALSSITQVR